MKIQKMLPAMFASLLVMVLFIKTSNTYAQAKEESSKVKDYCMMKDGKMMHVKGGHMMKMNKDMKMKNGTKCMINGECVMMDGTKMKMKEGEFMDMNGHMAKSLKELNSMAEIEDEKMESMAMYACPMHSKVTSDKPSKCSKCGMALVKKK